MTTLVAVTAPGDQLARYAAARSALGLSAQGAGVRYAAFASDAADVVAVVSGGVGHLLDGGFVADGVSDRRMESFGGALDGFVSGGSGLADADDVIHDPTMPHRGCMAPGVYATLMLQEELADSHPEAEMTTTIHSNGFPTDDDLASLFACFEAETLEPSFEQTGALREVDADGRVHYMGNFIDLSHVFRITTDDPELIERMDAAIASQLTSDAYRKERARAEAARAEAAARTRAGHSAPHVVELQQGAFDFDELAGAA